MEQLAQQIEALIFTADQPIGVQDIQSVLEQTFETKIKPQDIERAIADLRERYERDGFSLEIVEIANGFQFMTKPAFHPVVGTYLRQTTRRRLSRSALETLSIIAYKQPITKRDAEKIRGVSCDYAIQKLLEKELVTIIGRSDLPGRPLLYGTSDKFMDYFGLKDLKDLPKPKDFKLPDSEIGEIAPVEEELPLSDTLPTPAAPSSEEE